MTDQYTKHSARKSYARMKFYLLMVVGSVSGIVGFTFGFIYRLPLYFEWILFSILGFIGVYLMLMRCENCGTLLYRKDKKEHGFPHHLFLFQPKKCPVCGVDRV